MMSTFINILRRCQAHITSETISQILKKKKNSTKDVSWKGGNDVPATALHEGRHLEGHPRVQGHVALCPRRRRCNAVVGLCGCAEVKYAQSLSCCAFFVTIT